MKKTVVTLALIASITIVLFANKFSPAGRYLISASPGQAFRIDTTTGEAWALYHLQEFPNTFFWGHVFENIAQAYASRGITADSVPVQKSDDVESSENNIL